MWVITTRGFYSAVEKPEDRQEGMVTIRARTKADLDRLHDLIDAKPYRKAGYTDYPWRIRCGKDEWAAACYELAQEIDYPNFKDRVKAVLGAHRASILSNIWWELKGLERGFKPFKSTGAVWTPPKTDGKCRYCKSAIGSKHAEGCERWAGWQVINSDCTTIKTTKATKTKPKAKARTGKRGSRR